MKVHLVITSEIGGSGPNEVLVFGKKPDARRKFREIVKEGKRLRREKGEGQALVYKGYSDSFTFRDVPGYTDYETDLFFDVEVR